MGVKDAININSIKLQYFSGFYLNYDHILLAHPPLRDRMLYGLGRLAQIMNDGVSKEDSYFMRCYNFEQLLEQMYQG